MRTRAGLAAAVAVVLAVLASGCDDGDPLRRDGESAADFEARITSDEDSTPAEIVAAGEEVDVLHRGDLDLVTSVTSDPVDDDLTTQYAWQLLDGVTVLAEGKSLYWLRVTPVADGFVVLNQTGPKLLHVDDDGTVVTLPIGAARPTAAGDVLVGGEDAGLPPALEARQVVAYRAGTGARPGSAALVPVPPAYRKGDVTIQQTQLSPDGAVWARPPEDEPFRQPVTVLTSRDGSAPWRAEQVPVPARSYSLPSLTMLGADLYLFTAHGGIGGAEQVDDLWVRATEDADGRWARVPLDGIPFARGDAEPEVSRAEDGTLRVTNDGTTYEQQGSRFVVRD